MEAGKNSVIYMGLVPGPNKADNICGKTGTMQRVSTVCPFHVFMAMTGKAFTGLQFYGPQSKTEEESELNAVLCVGRPQGQSQQTNPVERYFWKNSTNQVY
jgi:hypothetical protein